MSQILQLLGERITICLSREARRLFRASGICRSVGRALCRYARVKRRLELRRMLCASIPSAHCPASQERRQSERERPVSQSADRHSARSQVRRLIRPGTTLPPAMFQRGSWLQAAR